MPINKVKPTQRMAKRQPDAQTLLHFTPCGLDCRVRIRIYLQQAMDGYAWAHVQFRRSWISNRWDDLEDPVLYGTWGFFGEDFRQLGGEGEAASIDTFADQGINA